MSLSFATVRPDFPARRIVALNLCGGLSLAGWFQFPSLVRCFYRLVEFAENHFDSIRLAALHVLGYRLDNPPILVTHSHFELPICCHCYSFRIIENGLNKKRRFGERKT
jgi:hypothetical protein